MLSRFKACMVGAVIGDGLGAAFEGMQTVAFIDIVSSISEHEHSFETIKEAPTNSAKVSYTDDTAMTRSVANSLLDSHQFNALDMAKRFSTEYFQNPDRGYGGNIVTVFEGIKALKDSNPDVFEPARNQFGGSGSYGNGGAMRIAPAALFSFHEGDLSKLKDLVSSITMLTHTHHLAINGALLQAFAVDQSLRMPQSGDINATTFIDGLISRIKPVEEESSKKIQAQSSGETHKKVESCPTPYCEKLSKIKDLLTNSNLKVKTVVEQLGNDVSAFGSVPAAIFSFLKIATQGFPDLENRSKFVQTIIYAIKLGGDTDTIASMAGAIAGSFYGMEQIPESWVNFCEGTADALIQAEEMYKQGASIVSVTE